MDELLCVCFILGVVNPESFVYVIQFLECHALILHDRQTGHLIGSEESGIGHFVSCDLDQALDF